MRRRPSVRPPLLPREVKSTQAEADAGREAVAYAAGLRRDRGTGVRAVRRATACRSHHRVVYNVLLEVGTPPQPAEVRPAASPPRPYKQ